MKDCRGVVRRELGKAAGEPKSKLDGRNELSMLMLMKN